MDLANSVAVVTGGARGIGKALAERFHRDGAAVAVADLDGDAAAEVAAQLEASRPGSAMGLHADVSTEQANVELIDAVTRALGPIDLFFANAGVAVGGRLSTPEDMWDLAFDVNVHAHRWAAKHLVPQWLERGRGYFCSTASAAGLLTQVGSAPYAVTKHAAVAFAEWLSVTYFDRGIRVSCLCPQAVNTDMIRPKAKGDAEAVDVVKKAGGVLEPEEVADITAEAIAAERLLILPHTDVQRYMELKATDHETWLAGMRKLQAKARPAGTRG